MEQRAVCRAGQLQQFGIDAAVEAPHLRPQRRHTEKYRGSYDCDQHGVQSQSRMCESRPPGASPIRWCQHDLHLGFYWLPSWQ